MTVSIRRAHPDDLAAVLQQWRTLRHITVSPSMIGGIARAALVLTPFRARLHQRILLRSPDSLCPVISSWAALNRQAAA